MSDFRMPSLGADMEAGTLVEWLVKPGQAVKRGDVIAVVETDKGAIDVEIWENGAIDSLLVPPGTKVPVGTTLATVRAAGAEAPAAAAATVAPVAPAPVSVPPPAAPPPVPLAVAGPAAPIVRASPAARRRARELQVDLAKVAGAGPHGAITVADVEAAAGIAPPAPAPPAAAPPSERAPSAPSVDIRRAIAAAMARSKREIPHYYLGSEVDVGGALAWLAESNRNRPVTDRLLPIALFVKATALAARESPSLNGFWVDGGFRPSEAVHVGVGISLRGNAGLVAPALHDVDRKPLDDIMREISDLIVRTRKGHLRSSEIADATITVTSMGDQGVETVFGVIYPPQVAIVGFGVVVERPRAIGGLLGVRPVVNVTLSGDHRASDGHTGGLFLAAITRHLSAPEAMK